MTDFLPLREILKNKKIPEYKDKNFFKVPHLFEERYGNRYTPAEKYFYIILLKLDNRFRDENGWFFHKYNTYIRKIDKKKYGFREYGFSESFCKKVRKKLIEDGLIETKYRNGPNTGNRLGTLYKLNKEHLFENS